MSTILSVITVAAITINKIIIVMSINVIDEKYDSYKVYNTIYAIYAF